MAVKIFKVCINNFIRYRGFRIASAKSSCHNKHDLKSYYLLKVLMKLMLGSVAALSTSLRNSLWNRHFCVSRNNALCCCTDIVFKLVAERKFFPSACVVLDYVVHCIFPLRFPSNGFPFEVNLISAIEQQS